MSWEADIQIWSYKKKKKKKKVWSSRYAVPTPKKQQ